MKIDKNTLFYLIAAGVFLVLKLIAGEADGNFFSFLLKPVAGMIEIFSGTSSTPTPEGAFLFPQFNILIDISCSGFNFLLLSFLMFSFMLIGYSHSTARKILALPISFVCAYLLTILVNTSRILVAILVQDTLVFDHPAIHQAIGIFVYLSSLIICYQALLLFLNRQNWSNAKLV